MTNDGTTQSRQPEQATRSPRPMPKKLLIANAALLGLLGLVTLAPSAGAQAAAGRVPGNYALVGGEVNFANTNAVYILDSANHQMVAIRVDDTGTNATIDLLGFRDLRLDSRSGGGR